MDLILKQYDSEVKTIEGERAFNVTMTTNDVDRSGDIVEPKGAKLTNFKKNPVVLMAHNYLGLPIGKASELKKSDTGITAKITFPEEGTYPLADTVYNLYKQKFMKAWSIGFIPIKSEDIVDEEDSKKMSRGRRYKIWELLELSGCAVPNNPNTLNNMVSKGIDIELLKEEGFIEIEEKEEKTDNEDEILDMDFVTQILEKDIITKPEETDDLIRIPAKGEEGKHKGHKIRWITVSEKEGIRGIYCITCKKIITFVFDKKKGWDMEKAKAWMEKHGKMVCDYFEEVIQDISDDKLKDMDLDIEYKLIKVEGEVLETTFTEVKEFNANEIYEIVKENKELKEKLEELELKAGAVLNAKNKKDLKNAQRLNQEADALIQQVLDSAGSEEDSLEVTDEKGEDDKDDNTIIDLVTDTVDDIVIDEEKDEDGIEIDEKTIKEIVDSKLDYALGRVKKQNKKGVDIL